MSTLLSLEIPNALDGVEDKIDAFMFSITGIHCKEKTEGEKYTLSLGDIEVGFYKNRHPGILDFRFSSYIKILSVVSEFMKDVAEFEIWVHTQKLDNHE